MCSAYDIPVVPHGSGPYSYHFILSQPHSPFCECASPSSPRRSRFLVVVPELTSTLPRSRAHRHRQLGRRQVDCARLWQPLPGRARPSRRLDRRRRRAWLWPRAQPGRRPHPERALPRAEPGQGPVTHRRRAARRQAAAAHGGQDQRRQRHWRALDLERTFPFVSPLGSFLSSSSSVVVVRLPALYSSLSRFLGSSSRETRLARPGRAGKSRTVRFVFLRVRRGDGTAQGRAERVRAKG